jgi:putative addiction module component (TIGR02574 family)
MKRDDLRAAALGLPVSERAELAYALLRSLHDATGEDAEAEWAAELERRAQAVADGTAKLADWGEARERVTARLRARRATRPPR